MNPRLTWLRTACGSGPTCAGIARHTSLPDGVIVRGYRITDPQVLADLDPAPSHEGYLYVPLDEVRIET